MVNIPILIPEFGIARLTNSVYVGTMKFTIDTVVAFLGEFPSEHPDVVLVTEQLAEMRKAYQTLDAAYALTLRSAVTDEIAALDAEGDQVFLAVKEMVAAAMRLTFDTEKLRHAQVYSEFLKKYKVNVQENMISEWSKIQQLCEEAAASQTLTQAEAALGMTAAMDRLTAIATQIRQKITQRSGELPEAEQMKKARAAMDPEYRAMITVINASAVFTRNTSFDNLIKTLNGNLNYVRIHAMSKTAAGDTPEPEPQPEPTPTPTPELS